MFNDSSSRTPYRTCDAIACFGVARRILLLAVVGLLVFTPREATAWGKVAHTRIIDLAISELPSSLQSIADFRADIADGAFREDPSRNKWASSLANGKDVATEVELLTFITRKEGKPSNYLCYRMGLLSRVMANAALPLAGGASAEHAALLRRFEADIEEHVETFRVYDVPCEAIKYPDIYLNHLLSKSRVLEGAVRDAYTSGDGYLNCEAEVVLPSFHRAIEAVASIWVTILSGKYESPEIPAARQQRYYIDQIRESSAKSHLDDIYSAFQRLHDENWRIPLTPRIVGNDFLELPCGVQTSRIYDIAALVDPQSTVVAERKRACDEYVLLNPVINKKKGPPRRRIPGSLHGRNGEAPDIYVYQHDSGHLLLSSKVKEVDSDYVLLNFKPVRKIQKRNIVRRFKSDPQTAEYDLERIIKEHSAEYKVSPALIKAIIRAESDFDPYAVSSAGARGLMQLMPSTALEMEVDDPFDPIDNVGGGVQYFAQMLKLFKNDTRLALAAYNAGPGNVLRYGGIPPFKETRQYVPRVLAYYEFYKKDTTAIKLKVALNKKPAADYLPETEVVQEIEEVISSPSTPASTPPGDYVVVRLKNGNTMRGKTYEKAVGGVKLKLERSWIFIREDLITEII